VARHVIGKGQQVLAERAQDIGLTLLLRMT
jgi:hypothetical protein